MIRGVTVNGHGQDNEPIRPLENLNLPGSYLLHSIQRHLYVFESESKVIKKYNLDNKDSEIFIHEGENFKMINHFDNKRNLARFLF